MRTKLKIVALTMFGLSGCLLEAVQLSNNNNQESIRVLGLEKTWREAKLSQLRNLLKDSDDAEKNSKGQLLSLYKKIDTEIKPVLSRFREISESTDSWLIGKFESKGNFDERKRLHRNKIYKDEFGIDFSEGWDRSRKGAIYNFYFGNYSLSREAINFSLDKLTETDDLPYLSASKFSDIRLALLKSKVLEDLLEEFSLVYTKYAPIQSSRKSLKAAIKQHETELSRVEMDLLKIESENR